MPKARTPPAIILLAMLERLAYDPDTGKLTWSNPRNTWLLGKEAGTISSAGYINVGVSLVSVPGRHVYAAHRIAWYLFYGEWITNEIDHKDGDRMNNSIGNLRIANGNGNSHNRSICSLNTSGFHGVGWWKAGRKWRARIMVNGKQRLIGCFPTAEAAYAARLAAEQKYHGEFATSNRPPKAA